MLLRINLLFLFVALSCQGATVTQNPAWWGAAHPSLLDGLVSYWKLDEDSGTRFDSWGTNHLTDVNGVGSAGGKLGLGITNNGTAYLYCEPVIKTKPYTVSAWVKFPVAADGQVPIGAWTSSVIQNTNTFIWLFDSTGYVLSVVVATNSGSSQIKSTTLSLNQTITTSYWHIAFSVDSSNLLRIYTNGVLGVSTQLAGVYVGKSKLTLMNFKANSAVDAHKGNMDEVAIFNQALSATEVLTLYNESKARRFPFNSGP